MLRGEKWSHCTGIAAFFLPNAVKSSKHVNVGQHKYHFRVQGMRHWSVSVEITERVRFFFFSKQIPSWTRLQCHLPTLI